MLGSQNSKLNICMNALDISGRELAKAIFVDYSLVSKWNNGKRVLSPRSVHLKKIVEYLISIDNQSGQNIIKGLLEQYFGKKVFDSSADFEGLLCRYLTEGNFNKTKYKNSHIQEYKVYIGNKGRREAVLELLDFVIASKNKHQLLLVSQEDMSWLTEDRNFLDIWEQKLRQTLLNGHKIKIIHWVDRHPDSLAAIYSKWLPMHLTGNLESFYYPLYTQIKQKQTLFSVQNEMVIMGNSIDDNPSTRYTATFYDPISVAHYERAYKSMLTGCSKLFEAYAADKAAEFWNTVQYEGTKPDNSYFIADVPFFISLPPEILSPLLLENNVDELMIEKCLKFSSSISSYSQKHYNKCIFSIDALEELSHKERFLCPELTHFIGKDIYITNVYYKKQLSYLADTLKTCENYEICLLTDIQKSKILPVSLWIKQNAIAIGWTDHPSPYAVSVSEPTLVTAACQFFGAVWERIPRVNRERTGVISALLGLTD